MRAVRNISSPNIESKVLKEWCCILTIVNQCKKEAKLKAVIATADVLSFYTSILHELGLQAISNFRTRVSNNLHPQFPKSFFRNCRYSHANYIIINFS